jgi:hypothetical protein
VALHLGKCLGLAGVRGGGGPLDGAGGRGLGAQVDQPPTVGAGPGARHGRDAGLLGGRADGHSQHGLVGAAGRRVGEQQQVGGVLADLPPDPLGELLRRVPA